MDTITIKIRRDTHERLKKAHVAEIGNRGRVMSFMEFVDKVLKRGLKSGRRKS